MLKKSLCEFSCTMVYDATNGNAADVEEDPRFQAVDKNQDGKLTQGEFLSFAREMQEKQRFDANLTISELFPIGLPQEASEANIKDEYDEVF